MPTAVETVVPAYAFCLDARCLGYLQEEVQGIRTDTSWTYLDKGGDSPALDSSTVMVRFADEVDAVCETCGGAREISEQLRPEYPNVSGHDPMGLFEFRGKTERELAEMRHHRELDKVTRDHELEDMRREMAELKAMLAERRPNPMPPEPPDDFGVSEVHRQKRGPGRPPKPKES